MSLWACAQRQHGLLAQQRKYCQELELKLQTANHELLSLRSKLEKDGHVIQHQKVKPYENLTRNMKWRRRKKIWTIIHGRLKHIPSTQIMSLSVNMQWRNDQNWKGTVIDSPHNDHNDHSHGQVPPLILQRHCSHCSQAAQPATSTNFAATGITSGSINFTKRLVYIKDKYHVSDSAIHEIKMATPTPNNFPTLNQIKTQRHSANSIIDIHEHHQVGVDAAYRKLSEVLSYVVQMEKYQHIMLGNEITLRFSTDGCRLTKRINSVRGTIQIVNPRNGSLPSIGPDDELSLYIFQAEEKRENQLQYAAETFRELNDARQNGIYLHNKHFHVNL